MNITQHTDAARSAATFLLSAAASFPHTEAVANCPHCNAIFLAKWTLACLAAAGSPPSPETWQPIETAPTRRKVLVTWINAFGKRRTALASYWPEGTLDMADDVPEYQVNEEGQNLDAGWWEESEGNDDAMFRLVEKMTHWQLLPSPPSQEPR